LKPFRVQDYFVGRRAKIHNYELKTVQLPHWHIQSPNSGIC